MKNIDAIETHALGYRFRSRLEARWALFFDAANIKFEYEPEGVKDGNIMYLPDFYFPEYDLYAEVKPDRPNMKEELEKPLQCVLDKKIERLMILQDIPKWTEKEFWWFPFFYYHNGTQSCMVAKCLIAPVTDDIRIITYLYPGYIHEYGFFGMNCANAEHISLSPIHDNELWYGYEDKESWRYSDTFDIEDCNSLHKAYDAARKARFEHGEKH